MLTWLMQRPLPPTLVAGLLVIAVGVGLVEPVLGPMAGTLRLLGFLPLAAGLTLTLHSASLFDRIGTNIKTFDEPGTLVDTGPFGFSRNPMYLGFLLLLVGVATLVGSLTAWIGPLAFSAAAQLWYIPFEEREMRAKFGPDYDRYVDRVRRWIGPPERKSVRS